MKRIFFLLFSILFIPGICFSRQEPMMRPDFWLQKQPEFLLGFLLIVIGILTGLVFLLKRKSSELYILYLAVFIVGYGARVLADNELLRMSVNVPRDFWEYIDAAVTDLLPVVFILFLQSFIGWGWKRSVFWLLLIWIAYGVTAMTIGIVTGTPHFIGGSINDILVILIIVVLGFNRYLARGRSTPEGRIIEIGLSVFILAVLYNNLAPDGFFLKGASVEQIAFLIFVCCMIYAAIKRSNNTEREYDAILHDLETARQIQLAILPQTLPVSSSCTIFPTYIPMTQIGGDFYAFHQVDDKHAGILIADVSGHGIPAALLASMIKVAFNSLVALADRPALLLESVNQALTGQLNNEFITTAYLWFNFADMTMHHASAGHPAPILIRHGKADDKPFIAKGIPIGIYEDITYASETIGISHGDRILLYTDGLTEVSNPRGELYGKERLLSGLTENRHLPLEKISNHIIGQVSAWSGRGKTESLDDDVTVIVIDVN
ncbi:MAG: PP2C family protein-serine/threonine phosphatase [Bacteroidetes bacterium]|nr:PP2C family protein-serine/threonine phosphatase [Bacteroidota bacterium]